MNRRLGTVAAAALMALALAGCREELTAVPDPVEMTDEALGYFCMMTLADHEGPKAQVHLRGMPDPIFFSQVRDGIAFLAEPERPADIAAIYVNDMSRAPDWQDPGRDNWIAAGDAWYVVGSDALGGMGVPEIVPFGQMQDAQAFARDRGGQVLPLADIPAEAVLGGVERATEQGS